MKAKKILLHTSIICWYLQHDLKLIAVHEVVENEQGKSFSWFPEEVANTRHDVDKDPLRKQLEDIAKLKGNSFYEKMREDLGRHKGTNFTRD